MNFFICIWSIIVTSIYLHSLVYISIQLFCFSQFLVVSSSKYLTEPKQQCARMFWRLLCIAQL